MKKLIYLIFNRVKNLPVVEAAYAIIAVVGGVARYLAGYLKGEKFNIYHFGAHAFVSGFSGYIFAHLSGLIGLNSNSVFFIAGLGGFMGTKAIELIIKRVDKTVDPEDKV